jgi:hypothetical protein
VPQSSLFSRSRIGFVLFLGLLLSKGGASASEHFELEKVWVTDAPSALQAHAARGIAGFGLTQRGRRYHAERTVEK